MAFTKCMTTYMLHFLELYPESYPRIIPRIIPMALKPCFEAYGCIWDIILVLVSRNDLCPVALFLVCMSIYLPVGHVFLGVEGAKAVRQCHQNDLLHKKCIFCFVFDKAQSSVLLLYFCRNSLLPESYPASLQSRSCR